MSKKHKRSKNTNEKGTFSKHQISDLIGLFKNNPNTIFTYKSVAKGLRANTAESRKLIYTILTQLSKENLLEEVFRGKFRLQTNRSSSIPKKGRIMGRTEAIEGHIEFTRRGTAYLITEEGQKDIFIAPNNTGSALDGDWVQVALIKRGAGREEGKVIAVLERKNLFFVGVLHLHPTAAFVKPDNQKMDVDIYIPKEKLNKASHGQKVLVKMNDWPSDAKSPFGEIIEILGMPGSNDAEMISILVENGIDYKFPDEVLTQAEKTVVELDEEEIKRRKDFRDVLTFTIDPADAKDFDDALSLRTLENGNKEVGVHIADVSHYVQLGSPMDAEALKRGNSVYLVDRVVPMLPEQLSNIACSLRPNEDKYSFSAVFEFDDTGKIVNEWFGKTAIHSNRRFSYEEAQEIIEGKEDALKSDLVYLDGLAKKYRAQRLKSGALSIESEELRFKLNELGQPEGVVVKTSKDAHKLIEEFMLLANRKVAEFLGKQKGKSEGQTLIYRVHDRPELAKIETFKVFLAAFGYELHYTNDADIAKSMNKLFEDTRYSNEKSIIQTMAIRSMAKASYETENIGHYGLAFSHYVHFTSPIRRYADLVIHRILHAFLSKEKMPYTPIVLKDIAKQTSRTERQAAEAERSSSKYFQVVFVKDHIGETFDAIISGLTDFGIFAIMEDNRCEGLIPMESIKEDRYYFEPQKFRVVGARNGRIFQFGAKIKVRLHDVDARKRTIDLRLEQED